MKLTRIRIDRYGPLQADLRPEDGIQLIQGPNESGKTLLTESILALVTGAEPHQARIDEPVSGFVVGVDRVGEHRFDKDQPLLGYIGDTHGHEMTPAEFRNIFTIRDADLRITDPSIYESITDHISGLRTAEIRALQEKVRDDGRLTPTLQLKNSKAYNKPDSQRDDAIELLEKIEEYLETASEQDLASAERRLYEAQRRRRTLETTIEKYEIAQERDAIRDARETLGSLETRLDERETLPSEETVASIRDRVETVSERAAEQSELEARRRHYHTLTLASLGTSMITWLVFSTVVGALAWVIVPLTALIITVYASVRWRGASASLSRLAHKQASVLDDGQKAGISAESLEDLRAEVADIERQHEQLERLINEKHGALQNALGLTTASPQDTVDAAAEILAQREQQLVSVDIEYGEDALESSRRELETVTEEIESIEAALDEHRKRLSTFATRAQQLDFDRFAETPLDIEVASLEALELLAERLEEFRDSIDRQARTARDAHHILEEMEQKEGQRIVELFGAKSRAAAFFKRITTNDYQTVRYDPDRDEIVVDHAARGQLTPHELSKATTDQLYFSVRVGLAKRLFSEEPGFLLLDEAFLASDAERLERQVDLLTELAADGWQILYLTAKEDVIEQLSAVSSNDPLVLPRL